MTGKAIRIVSALIFFLFLLAAFFGDQGLIKLYRLRKVEKTILSKNSQLELKNKKLISEIQDLKNPQQLERIIRTDLNMIRPDEMVFILNDK